MTRSRFTIARLMIAVAIVAGGLGLLRLIGPIGGLVLLIAFGLGLVAFHLPRLLPGHPELIWWGVVVATTLFCFPIYQNEVYTLGADWFAMSHVFLTLATPMLVGAALGWSVVRFRRGRTPRYYAEQALIVALLILPWTMIWTHWPLYRAFAQAQGALNELADRVEAGEAVTFPARAGTYSIEEAKRTGVNGQAGTLLKIGGTRFQTAFVRAIDPDRGHHDLGRSLKLRNPNRVVRGRHDLGNDSGPFVTDSGWRFAPNDYSD